MFANGRGISKDDAEAVRWYRKAAEQGNAKGQNNLGSCPNEKGQGVSKDEDLRRCGGFLRPQNRATLKRKPILGLHTLMVVAFPKDDMEAVRWFRKAVEQGNANAQIGSGAMYSLGRGVAKKDKAEAVQWFPQGRRARAMPGTIQSRGPHVLERPKALPRTRPRRCGGTARPQSRDIADARAVLKVGFEK